VFRFINLPHRIVSVVIRQESTTRAQFTTAIFPSRRGAIPDIHAPIAIAGKTLTNHSNASSATTKTPMRAQK
jgi:hypothetical protein